MAEGKKPSAVPYNFNMQKEVEQMKKCISLCIIAVMILCQGSDLVFSNDDIIISIPEKSSSLNLDVNIEDVIGGKSITMEYSVDIGDFGITSVIGGSNTIMYSTDGSDPEYGQIYFKSSPNPYYEDIINKDKLLFTEAGSFTFRAVAHAFGLKSNEFSQKIVIEQTETPIIKINDNRVTIKTNTSSANIYYTTDGSMPTTDSNLYTSGISLNKTSIIKAIAVKSGYSNSGVAEKIFETPILEPTSKPEPTPVPTPKATIEPMPVSTLTPTYYPNVSPLPDQNKKEDDKSEFINDPNDYQDDFEKDLYNDQNDEDQEEYWSENEESQDDEDVLMSDFSGEFFASDWARDEVNRAYEKDLIPEEMTGEDLSDIVSREEFAALAVKLYEKLSGTSTEAIDVPFDDCYNGGNAYFDYIGKAYSVGITNGVDAYHFEPESHISRQDLATMLLRVIKKYKISDWSLADDMYYNMDISGIKPFADDNDISDYAKESVYYLAKYNVILGIDETHFAPQNLTYEQIATDYATATKEQAILMSLRTLNNISAMNMD